MLNALTGTIMYVEESRKDEYLKKGHALFKTEVKEDVEKTAKPSSSKRKTK